MLYTGVDCEALKSALYKCFGPQSAYEDEENARYAVGKEDKISESGTTCVLCVVLFCFGFAFFLGRGEGLLKKGGGG